MVMPQAGRIAAAVVGGLLILASVASVSGTLIVPRWVQSRLTRWIAGGVDWGSHLATARAADYRRRDRLLATQAAAILVIPLAAWLCGARAWLALLPVH